MTDPATSVGQIEPRIRWAAALGLTVLGAAACLLALRVYGQLYHQRDLSWLIFGFGFVPMAALAFAVHEGLQLTLRASDPKRFRAESPVAAVATVLILAIMPSSARPIESTALGIGGVVVLLLLMVDAVGSHRVIDHSGPGATGPSWLHSRAVRAVVAAAALGFGAALVSEAVLQTRLAIDEYSLTEPSTLRFFLTGATGLAVVALWFLWRAMRTVAAESNAIRVLVAVGGVVAAAASVLFAGLRSDLPWLVPITILAPIAIWLALSLSQRSGITGADGPMGRR